MSDITKEQILRLENIGLVLAERIEEKYHELNNSNVSREKQLTKIYSDFKDIVDNIDINRGSEV